jgi:hypothetical protein
MDKTQWVHDTLTLAGKEISVKLGSLRQSDLRFYAENPRVYSIIRPDEAEPSQSEIEERLGAMEHVRQLRQSILANGGLIDPLIVREGDYVVLEGNSRLAAYRILAKSDPIKWGPVKVKLLPCDIGEDVVFALLGEYHIIGRKDWAPYEQAGYVYRRQSKHGMEPAKMAKEMGLSTRKVNHLLSVYRFMVEHKDNNVDRWSYYDEYLKHNETKKARQEHPELDGVVAAKIASGEIPRAIDVRDKLTAIARAGGKVLKRFMESENTFEECYERATVRGAKNLWPKRFYDFRMQLVHPDTLGALREMTQEHRKRCVYELRKIKDAAQSLLKKVG